jgi:hypothetical protein
MAALGEIVWRFRGCGIVKIKNRRYCEKVVTIKMKKK